MSGDILIKFLVAAVLAGTPFLFGTVGEILSEKVGYDVPGRLCRVYGRLSVR